MHWDSDIFVLKDYQNIKKKENLVRNKELICYVILELLHCCEDRTNVSEVFKRHETNGIWFHRRIERMTEHMSSDEVLDKLEARSTLLFRMS